MVRLVRTPVSLREGLAPGGLKEMKDYLLLTLVLYFAEISAARGGVAGGAGDRFLLSLLAQELVTKAGTVRVWWTSANWPIDARWYESCKYWSTWAPWFRLDGSAGE